MAGDFEEFASPEWALMSQVSRPSRYAGSEWRPYPKTEWDASRLKICLAFPDVYEIGMSYYGFQIIEAFIYGMDGGYLADRAYCVWPDMEELMRRTNTPLTSTEHRKPLKDFDVIAFTLPHEAGYTNILTMIDLAGLRVRSAERSEADPIVIAGGYGAYVPEPMSSFIDVFCVGEAEALLPSLLPVLAETKGLPRAERLQQIASLPGMYVPLFPHNVVRQISREIFTLSSMIVPSVGIVHDRAAVELFRGCSRGCRFCQAGMVNRPVRERPVDEAKTSILSILKTTGWEEAGLLSLASCDYSGIEQLIDDLSPELNERRAKLSLPSLRMDGFSVGLAERLEGLRSKHGSITFAPEAGTQRMRDVINKGINEEMIMNCLREIFSRGWDRVKLYFMMGLPTETYDDLDAIAELSYQILKLGRSMGRRKVTVSVSVSGFVPKAHTPFQWERQNSIEELRDKGRHIKSQIHDRAISAAYHEPEQTFLEGVLSRGDKRTGEVILRAWQTGARFDNWTEYFDLSRWLEAFSYCGLEPEEFTRERGEAETLAWDFVKTGVSKEFLLRERHKAYAGELTVDCLSGCAACGIGCAR
ncbi:MAG: radical SAM protein [Synergistaceae bacterium]|nr:radical SAM protein [Synergistaceae bacterium]